AQRGQRGRSTLRGPDRGRREGDRARMIDPVTSRYAEALFSLATRRGALELVRADVARLADELRDGGMLTFVFDERQTIEARRARVSERIVGLHVLTQDFVNLVLDKRRVGGLR